MQFQLEYADGTERVVRIFASDLIEYERHFGKSAQSLDKTAPLDELFFVMWVAETRAGNTSDDYETWRMQGVDATDADPKAPANRATRRRQPSKRS